MCARHITVDWSGNVYEITHMLDVHGKPTTDLSKVAALVMVDVWGRHIDADPADVPIYTVH